MAEQITYYAMLLDYQGQGPVPGPELENWSTPETLPRARRLTQPRRNVAAVTGIISAAASAPTR